MILFVLFLLEIMILRFTYVHSYCLLRQYYYSSTFLYQRRGKIMFSQKGSQLLNEKRLLATLELLKISPTATLLLCVSGGVDSMAMLHLFKSLQNHFWPNLGLKIINFNHKARLESDEESQFVQKWGDIYQMDVFHRDFPIELRNTSNFQEMARNWRRKESLQVIDSLSSSSNRYIVTAHHKEDQVETILMKLLRGTFITNLSPMQALDGVFLRPFLEFQKEELRNYMIEKQLEWREDSSNQKRVYKRNQIRLDLIPVLSDLTGGFLALSNRLLSLSKQSQDLSYFLNDQVQYYSQHFQLFRTSDKFIMHILKDFKDIPRFLLGEILHRWIKQSTSLNLGYSLLQSAIDLGFKAFDGKKSISLTISQEYDLMLIGQELRIIKRGHSVWKANSELGLLLGNPSINSSFFGNVDSFSVVKDNHSQPLNDLEQRIILPDGVYEIRYSRDGDRYRKQDKVIPLVDLFRELKIPVNERDRSIVIYPRNQSLIAVAVALLYPQKDEEGYSLTSAVQQSTVERRINSSFRIKWLDAPKRTKLL